MFDTVFISLTCFIVVCGIGLYCRWIGREEGQAISQSLPDVNAPLL